MKRTVRWCAVAVVLLALFALLRWRASDPAASIASTRATAAAGATNTARATSPGFAVRVTPLPGSVSGHVRDPQGQPIAGARVCATCASCEATGTAEQVCGDSDPNGAYQLAALSAVGHRLLASARGFAPNVANRGQPLFLAAGQVVSDVDIALQPGGVELSGSVLDATGGPLGGASIRIVSWGAQPLVSDVQSGDDGRFAAWVAEGRASLIATADGYAQARAHAMAPSRSVELVLTPGASLAGTVVRGGDKRPIAGAEVIGLALGMSPLAGQRVARSGPDGRFALAGLEPNEYTLIASAPGYRGQHSGTIGVGLGAQRDAIELVVWPAAQVAGKVLVQGTDAPCTQGLVTLGAPAMNELGLRPGSKLTFESISAGPRPPASLTSPIAGDGSVRFDAVPPGQYYVTVQCHEHVASAGPETVIVRERDLGDLTWRVEPGLGLAIRVVDEARAPVPFAGVLLHWPPRGEGGTPTMGLTADGEGRVRVGANLYPGRYTIRPQGRYEAEPLAVELAAGMGVVEVEFPLAGSGAIEVVVTTPENATVDGLRVSAQLESETEGRFSAVARGDGRYRLGPLRPGSYRVEVSDEINPAVSARAIELSARQVITTRVTWARSAEIRGRVLDSHGHPLANAWVSAVHGSAPIQPNDPRRALRTERRVLSDGEGRFALGRLASDESYNVRAQSEEGSVVIARSVRVGSEIALSLPEPASVRGSVIDAAGPVPDFAVRAVEANTGSERRATFSRASGQFALEGLTPGQVEISVMDPAGQAARIQVELAPGQQRDGLRFTLAPPQLTANAP